MIIDKTYFQGQVYIPQAKAGITDSVSEVAAEVDQFIADYVRECLIKCLGFQLFTELSNELDSTQPNGLKVTADAKWDDLLNGKTYIDQESFLEVHWRGIRFKSIESGDYNRSFLAYYTYYFFEDNDHITRASTGHTIITPKNAENVTPTKKVVTAWNKFVEIVQGYEVEPKTFYTKDGMIGIDYRAQVGVEINMNQFIEDANTITPDTYENFNPTKFERINQFGF